MNADVRALELLSVDQTYRADQAAAEAGVSGAALMEAAGRAVAEAMRKNYAPCSVLVLCGPGNNGGDGFVAARHLKSAGWPARVALLGERGALKGDAAAMAARWDGVLEPLRPDALSGAALVVDALFGAGLARPLEGVARACVEAIDRAGVPCVSIDIPSGVEADSGAVLGAAPRAALTVTFCRRKPGHLLLPGRLLAGRVIVADIGISDAVVASLKPDTFENGPALWLSKLPRHDPEGHKYGRGHAVVVGGGSATSGAARLGARGALRIGAGLVTTAFPPEALPVYAAHQTAVMNAPIADTGALVDLLADERRNAVLLGPGLGLTAETAEKVLAVLSLKRRTVLDADALTVFEGKRDQLVKALHSDVVLTPHEGEYARLFRSGTSKLERARVAARESGAVILLKGGDSVIAAPDGRAAINTNGSAELATAGAGDVLAGFVLGLMAQGMAAFESAAAACWLHGESARAAGRGLIAEDLPEHLPPVLAQLLGPL